MTVGELKKFIESNNVTDDFVIDVMGEYSEGSFGSVFYLDMQVRQTPDGEYKELILSIRA